MTFSRGAFMYFTRLLAIVLTAAAVSCSSNSSGSRTESGPAPASSAASRSSDVITAEELSAASVQSGDALEAVRRLRPRFLSSRGKGSIRIANAGAVHVSIDGGPLLTANYLARVRATDVAEIRYLNAADATTRFGTNAGSGGVLLVKSR